MQKTSLIFVIITMFLFLSFFPNKALAQNNKFGIHILNESDLDDAAKLVNSSGGEWGYVTIVIREDERDISRWQSVFDRMRELKLIPIVRLATKNQDSNWKKPIMSDADSWADFLSSLNWVVKDRYVILFNEPNHSGEWGGSINPLEYSEVARAFQKRFKELSSDFFILPAGFDASAPNGKTTMSANKFWDIMAIDSPEIFSIFDGWTSHSYPNPAFSSSPNLSGKGSVRSFAWEVGYLEKYGLRQNIPIFITETGWVHSESKDKGVPGFSSETIGDFFKSAYSNAWADRRIKAVTPFILNYPAKPFKDFSWKKPNNDGFYPHFTAVQEMPKIKGSPSQVHNSAIVEHSLPNKLITDSYYHFKIRFKNTGQSIWSETNSFSPDFRINGEKIKIDSFFIKHTKPGESPDVQISFNSPSIPGNYQYSVQIQYREKLFGELLTHSVEVVEPPKLAVSANNLFGIGSGENFKLLIYKNNEPVKEFTNFTLEKGDGEIDLRDVSPDENYRFVLVKPYHLPVQTYALVSVPETKITFPLMLPIDRNNDGKLSWNDLKFY